MRRYLMWTTLILIVAALANVGTAWAIAFWGELDNGSYWQTYSHPDDPRWSVGVFTGFGATHVSRLPEGVRKDPMRDLMAGTIVPAWSRAHERPSDEQLNDPGVPWLTETAYGWPLRSMVTAKWKHSLQPSGVNGNRIPFEPISGIRVADTGLPEPVPYRLLPVKPIPLGFLLNTLLYAAIIGAVLYVPITVRRAIRIGCGRCGRCGYPLGSAGCCSECGAPAGASSPLGGWLVSHRRSLLRLGLLVLALAGGALVNYAVAWACVAWIDPSGTEADAQSSRTTEHGTLRVTRRSSFGVTVLQSSHGVRVREHQPGDEPDRHVPGWSGLEEPSSEFERALATGYSDAIESRVVVAAGWPLRSVWAQVFGIVSGGRPLHQLMSVEGGFEAPLPKWQRPWPRVLPTRPVPLGFAVDTLLYALVLGLLVAGAVRLVRRVRRL